MFSLFLPAAGVVDPNPVDGEKGLELNWRPVMNFKKV